ncbi:MAG: SDR family oxidoreductase [Planctomycetes bacterium]|nr:SDR family oxidoreductase [Planctomycetota bacterium]
MRYCLVTGGAGFIGSHLVEHLVAGGWKVRVLDNLSTGKANNLSHLASRIDFIQGSINDFSILKPAVAGCEVVFHLAALPSVARSLVDPMTTHDVCATGTLSVLDAARQMGVRRVVYAASSSAYGGTPGALRVETDPIAPLSPYASSKLAGELYCQSFTNVYGLETARLRFFNVFGPRQDARSPYTGVIALFIAAMLEGKRPIVQGDGLQSRDFTYVENAVQAVVNAADAPDASGKVYNIGNGETTTILDLVRRLNEILGADLVPIHAPARAGDVRHSKADISLARRDLKYNPQVSFVEGLRRTVEAQRAI